MQGPISQDSKTTHSGSAFVFALMLLTALLAPPVMAQVTTATIYGRVLDPSGAVIPGAAISAVNEATGVAKAAESNERGEFAVPYVPVGPYSITVEAAGFNTHAQSGVNLSSGQTADFNFVLEIGATTEMVEVTADAPLLNTTSAEQDISLNSDQVDPDARAHLTPEKKICRTMGNESWQAAAQAPDGDLAARGLARR